MTNKGADSKHSPIPYASRPDDGRGGKKVPLRLQRYLARCGVASRRASEGLMTAGRVTVNGKVAAELGTKVDPLVDEVRVDGQLILWGQRAVSLMLYKPAGVITTMKAQSEKPIVAQLVPCERYPGLYPVGRLDADTTGLLLFSTDGRLGNALLHPSHHVTKSYLVRVADPLADDEALKLKRGVELEDGMTAPAELAIEGEGGRLLRLTIHEGRYHQVKRMLQAVGHPVLSLHRVSFGPLELGGLPQGAWRLLDEGEMSALYAAAGLEPMP